MELEKNERKMKIDSSASMQMLAVEPKKKRKGGKFFKLLFLIILAGLIYSQYQLYILKNPNYQQKLQADKNEMILKKAGALMILPSGSPKQILYIQDADKIKAQQPFFKDAMNDDAVLVYKDIAIIYSPSRNKIINVGPIVSETQPTQEVSTSTTAPKTDVKTEKSTSTKR
jgi:hypothetical protein